MKKENLFEALTNIDDKYIKEAVEYKKEKNKKTYVRYFALAASIAIIFGSIFLLKNNRMNSNNPININGGDLSMNSLIQYEGPIFPLISLNKENEIKSDRKLIFDLEKNFEDGYKNTVKIEDKYFIDNDGDEDIKLIYPISGRLIDGEKNIPEILINNKKYKAKLYIGDRIERVEGDEEKVLSSYKDLLKELDQKYIKDSMEEKEIKNEKVYVYEISNAYKNDEDNELAPNLALSYNLDKNKTKVYSYLMDGYIFDRKNNKEARSFFIDEKNSSKYGRKRYIFVLGNDIENVQLKAYKDGSLKDEYVDGGGDIKRYESDLFSIIDMVGKEFKNNFIRENKNIFNNLDDKEVFNFLIKELDNEDNTLDLNEYLYSLTTDQRIFLLELNLSKDEKVEISFDYMKNLSKNYVGNKENFLNYYCDLITILDDSIEFNKEIVNIINTDEVEFLEDNFNFELKGDVLEKKLDLDKNYYNFIFKWND